MNHNFETMGFEHLHRHSDTSILDGFAKVHEYAEYSAKVNQRYLTITDHGVMGAVPSQIAMSEKYNLSPIYGCELYINPLQPKVENRYESAEFRKSLDESQIKFFDKSYHLLGIAYNFTGYQNLVRLSSWAWIHGFYRKPRINHEMLQKHKEGIIFTSTCANSEIAQAFLRNQDDQEGFDMIQKYIDMLDRDHFYLELMMLDFKLQKPYDAFLIRAHDKFNLPLITSQDCHYCLKEHSKNQQLMLIQQNGKTLAEIQALIDSGVEDIFELQDTNLWMKSETELDEKWLSDYSNIIDYDLYKESKANTLKICEYAAGVELDRTIKLPELEGSSKLLLQEVMTGFEERRLPKTKKYLDRIKEEYSLICNKGFASYFLIQQQMTNAARKIAPQILGWGDEVDAVGPGRGCLSPDSKIYKENGESVSIIDIEEDDYVWTIDGSKRKVIKTWKYPCSEKLLEIKTHWSDQKIALTSDHKVYATSDVDTELSWIEAKDLKSGDWLFSPIPKIEIWKQSQIEGIVITPDVATVLANVIAWGELEEPVKSILKGKPLGSMAEKVAEIGFIPNAIIHGTDEIITAFLKGYLYASGYNYSKNHKFRFSNDIIASQLRFLLLRLGIPSSVEKNQTKHSVNCPLMNILGSDKESSFNKRTYWKKIENGLLTKVISVDEIDGPEFVYDLQVEGNENYLTNNFLVHNSAAGSLVAYCLNLHDVEPVHHGLLFSRFLSPVRGGKQMKIRFSGEPI